MCAPLPERDGALSEDAAEPLKRLLIGKSALAAGPGLSMRTHASILKPVLDCGLPAALDADALNLVAREGLPALPSNCVITPHPGEAARLLNRQATDPLGATRALHAMGPVALLKGACTVVAGESVHLVTAGTPGMARGGSGDALTGILGALLAAQLDPETAAWSAAELHGLAGRAAASRLTETCMTPLDLIADMPDAIRKVLSE
jgi:NAD(P)H-hydrate epimerase